MIDTLLRLSDRTLHIFALIAAGIASLFAIWAVLTPSDDTLAFASLDRPLPEVTRLQTSETLQTVEGLGLFEETLAIEREQQRLAGEIVEPEDEQSGPGALPQLSAIVMQDDRITAFSFKDGIVMRFEEGDTVAGWTIVNMTLSDVTFRDESGDEESVVLFGTSVTGTEDAGL